MTLGVPALAAGFASKFDTIGPYVGFGSLIAVVAMAVLVFAQGRELQRLREWAGTSPERLDALEEQVRSGAVQTGAPAAPGAPRPGTLARHPGVPVAAGAAPPGVPAPAGATLAPPAPGAPVMGASTTNGPAVPPGPPGVPGGARPVPPRPTPPGGDQATRVVPAAANVGGPRAATPAGAAASTARERDAAGGHGGRSIGQIVGVGAVALVVLVALLFAFGVIGGDSDSKVAEQNRQEQQEQPKRRAASPRYSRAATRVTVLNASGTTGVAKTVTDAIDERLRFPMGEAGNYRVNGAAAPNASTSTVAYATGTGQAGNRAAAQKIASTLNLKPSAVKAMSAEVRANAPDAKVVVIVGSDLATRYATPTTSSRTTTGTEAAPSGTATPGAGGGATATAPSGTATPTDPPTAETPATPDAGAADGVTPDPATGGGGVTP